jgi:TonB-linked SusC/RagA family outer membrane protein
MGRLFYGLKNKYLFTGTLRRDGFSGFSEQNKFGLFPSMSVAWVASEEPFISEKISWMNQLKFRMSYGSIGNRTIGRYQTLAKISGGYDYITAAAAPVFTQSITTLASPNLKWETTTGVNIGVDFGFFSRKISGTIDYYNNNTKDLLYEVDIPGITRFEKFPDNLGKLHNHGLEISLTSINLKKPDFEWTSSLIFSRNRNQLKELLGFDLDGDGKEDDLVSAGLFIGKPLDAIYTYKIDGKWQVNETIPAGFDLGSNKVVDINKDGLIDAKDKTIIGYRDPSYRFSINNSVRYKNWTFKFFINSVQGGKDFYWSADDILGLQILNQENHFNVNFPSGIDYWTPENPNAQYQRPNINVSDGLAGSGFSQRNFTRLQDVSLSYDFPDRLIKKMKLQNLKFYVSGKNLLTITDWNGWDPETGEKITRSGLPVIKSYTFGVNVEF